MNPFFFDLPYRSAFVANMAGKLRDTINEDCQHLLLDRSIITPVTDVSLVIFISENSFASITEIARGLDYSHQRTAARVSAIEKLGLIAKHKDTSDSRCKRFELTQLGRLDLTKLQDVYENAALAFDDLFKNQENDLMLILKGVIDELKQTPLSARISSQEQLKESRKI